MRQPTPQNGQTESTLRSTFWEPMCVLGLSAPVGQACTHSPQATQVLAAMGSSRSKTILLSAPRSA